MQRDKKGRFMKGMTSWNKGMKLSEEHKRKLSLIERKNFTFKNRKHSKESKIKMSKRNKGRIAWNKGQKTKKETLEKLSKIRKGKIPSEITKEKVSKTMRKRVELGLHNFWKGGISFEPYTIDFNERFKKGIRRRDNYVCQLCNKQLQVNLSVHHIDYNKKNTFKQNCISLCHDCHTITNGNRLHWTSFFQDLLKDKYNYKTLEQKVVI